MQGYLWFFKRAHLRFAFSQIFPQKVGKRASWNLSNRKRPTHGKIFQYTGFMSGLRMRTGKDLSFLPLMVGNFVARFSFSWGTACSSQLLWINFFHFRYFAQLLYISVFGMASSKKRSRSRYCAVNGCMNSDYRLSKWGEKTCELHGINNSDCDCLPPFQ